MNPVSVPQPALWSLHGYFPSSAAHTPARRLGRLRELLPAARQARKAA